MTEFLALVDMPQVRSLLQVLELDYSDTERLFHLLDRGSGVIRMDDWITGALRIWAARRSRFSRVFPHTVLLLRESMKQRSCICP